MLRRLVIIMQKTQSRSHRHSERAEKDNSLVTFVEMHERNWYSI